MQIHMIGHASIFVETKDCNILMDPILFDPHSEGIEDVYPKREVDLENFPEFDLLVISHRHLDHFHLRSLASLPKDVDVLIPKDKVMENCLRQLGFSQVYQLGDFDEVNLGATKLLATRSENRVPELGFVLADDTGTFWNQVDTVVSPETIGRVKSIYPQIDFLLTPWQPMLEIDYQHNRSISFPYDKYNSSLEKIKLVQAKAIAPGANGFKLTNSSSWLNQITFPVTRERFCHDLKAVCPEVGSNIYPLNPGDILAFKNCEFSYLEQMSQFVNLLEDKRESLDFSPVQAGNPLVDDNLDNYDLEKIQKVIEKEVCVNFPQFFKEKKSSLMLYHRWKVIFQLEVVFPNRKCQWYFDFAEKEVKAHSGRNPLANLFTSITASSFYGLIEKITGWDYAQLGGNFRSFKKVYMATEYGITLPHEYSIQDLLSMKYPYQDNFEHTQYHEVKKWVKDAVNPLEDKNNSMLEMGNTLVRIKKKSR